MKIAHVSDCYLPGLGGIEIQVHDLAQHQIAAGHEVTVLTCTPDGRSGVAGAGTGHGSGAEPGSVPVIRTAPAIATLPTAATRRQLTEILGSGSFDAIHVHSSVVSPFAWYTAQLATSMAIPTVVTMHSVLQHHSRLVRLSGTLGGWPRWPVAWTAVSEVAADPLRRVLGAKAVDVFPNGIDPRAWSKPLPRLPEDDLTIVSVMRLARRKRPTALLRTLAGIRASIPASVPLRAVIIGDGPQQPQLERHLQLTGMRSWVTLTGRLTRPQIRPLLWDADVYLAPAQLESFGIAALEARCAGLPVIAMAAGGVREFIRDGREGFLVQSDDEMVAVTSDLLTSPGLRVIQEHNRRSVPSMTWPDVVELSVRLYATARARTVSAPRAYDAAGV